METTTLFSTTVREFTKDLAGVLAGVVKQMLNDPDADVNHITSHTGTATRILLTYKNKDILDVFVLELSNDPKELVRIEINNVDLEGITFDWESAFSDAMAVSIFKTLEDAGMLEYQLPYSEFSLLSALWVYAKSAGVEAEQIKLRKDTFGSKEENLTKIVDAVHESIKNYSYDIIPPHFPDSYVMSLHALVAYYQGVVDSIKEGK